MFTNPAITSIDGDAVIARSDAQAIDGLLQSAAPRKARPSRVGPDQLHPGCRRRTGQPVSALLKKTQGERLRLIGTRNRAMAIDDARNLLLERLGLIQRLGAPRLHHLRGHPLIEWTITDAGMAALSEIRAATRRN